MWFWVLGFNLSELTSQRLRYRIPSTPQTAIPTERFAIALPQLLFLTNQRDTVYCTHHQNHYVSAKTARI
ncbi:MAG: hypothetical protein RLZZ86_916 [Cyanobacteriota bacterium]|jgi:hypothetical protein